MRSTRISLGLMINAGAQLTLSRRLIFRGPMIVLGLIGVILSAVKLELIDTYSEAKHLSSFRNRDVLMNARSPHK